MLQAFWSSFPSFWARIPVAYHRVARAIAGKIEAK
jgi:hypothetical protein